MRLLLAWDDEGGDVTETSLDQFLEANADGLDEHEASTIAAEIAACGIFHGAGAQSLRWTLGTPFAVAEYLSRQASA